NSKPSRPPRLFTRLFDLVVRSEEKRTIAGDLEELFGDAVERRGRFGARLWYAGQILRAFPSFLSNTLYWRLSMFANYLKITLRNIRKHKAYSFINIAGLAMGIACCVLVMLWVQDELSYDRFHEHAGDLYVATFSNGSTVTPTALAPFLKAKYPEVQHASRLDEMRRNLLRHEDTQIYQEGGILVDPDFLSMFTVRFLRGGGNAALDDARSILLSEEVSKKLFRAEDPLGQTVVFNTSIPLKVTGVFADYLSNSHIRFDYVLPLELSKAWNWDLDTWERNNIRSYVHLRPGTDARSVDAKVSGVVEQHRPQDKRPLSLQPITRLHLNPDQHAGRIAYVYLFSALAFFTLIIACINFINLTTARSLSRAKEIGIRKTVGAYRTQLVKQFFGESMFLTIIASAVGIGLVLLFLPKFNNLTGKAFSGLLLLRQNILLGIFGIVLLTVFIAGNYPAFLLSRCQPVHVLGGKAAGVLQGKVFRKVLVVFQFSLSAFLILGTVMIFRQVHFLRESQVGYNKDNVVIFGVGSQFRQNIDTIKTELLANPDILNITLTDIAPYRWQSNAGVGDVDWEGKSNQQVKMVMTSVDYDFLDTFELEMKEGRFFARRFATDPEDAFVVNEAAVRAMEMDNPVGKWLKVWDDNKRIIGVVKDYHFESLHSEIIPMAMRIDPREHSQACVRIAAHRIQDTLAILEAKWKEFYPEYPFEYRFLDDALQNLYRSEYTIGEIVTTFTLLALFISCLGIFGLSSYTAERRTKEIGIRKVLGASVPSLVQYLSQEFVQLVAIANVLVWPVAYFVFNKWLQTFAYRITIGWWTFVLAGIFVLVVSLLTAGWQIIRAARTNPVHTLRYE
ncbi:MAG: ABC transporter permease, partial [Candidatus Aminicenantes bacterium]|nr:ABC transporter permease [Candidatus Aminicenantes bacterium]